MPARRLKSVLLPLPLAPTRAFGQPLLGTVGEATAEVVEASDGAVRPGDPVGLSGLQARYDEQLRGTPGVEVLAVDDDPRNLAMYRDEGVATVYVHSGYYD